MEQTNMTQTISQTNGRITAKQEVRQIRANQPSREAPFGEFWDNSIGWGDASKILTIFTPNSIIIGDNGNFESEDTFSTMWLKVKLGNEPRYDENNEEQLGKYNAGATDSVIILGDNAIAYHNFNGVVKRSVFDLSRYKRDGQIIPNITNATLRETEDFNNYALLLNPEYDLSTGCGTFIKIVSLCKTNTPQVVNKVIKFSKGLYLQDATECEICVYNWLNDEWPDNRNPTQIIVPIDITFNSPPEITTIYVYNTDDGERLHTENESDDHGDCLLSYTINSWILTSIHQRTAEQNYYGYTNDSERVGFSVYRAGRNVTHTPKLWELNTGMDRARGIRITVNIPASKYGDEIFGIGTQKILTNDSWSHFDRTMKTLFKNKFKNLENFMTRDRKRRQNIWINEYEQKLQNVTNLDHTGAQTQVIEIQIHLDENFGKEELIKKRCGRAYKAWKNYQNALIEHIETFNLEPDVLEPDVLEPDVLEPNVLEPNVLEPDVLEPDVLEPNVLEPNVLEPNVLEPDVLEPDVLESDVLEPDVLEPGVLAPTAQENTFLEPDVLDPVIPEPDVLEPSDLSTEATDWCYHQLQLLYPGKQIEVNVVIQ